MKTQVLWMLALVACNADAAEHGPADPAASPPPAQAQTIAATASFVALEPPPVPPSGTAATLRIAYASVHVAIEGGVARTTIDEVMVNDQPAPIEATFSFPLPDDATVTDFADWRDGKRVAASLTGKEQARERFEKAAAEGKAASLGEADGRTFSMKVAALPGRGQRRIELVYTQTVHSLGGERTWALPARHYTEQVPTHLDLAVELTGAREITGARELNHDDARVVRSSASRATVLLARSRRPLERDVVVRWTEPTADLDLAGRAARRTAGEPGFVSARFGFERDPDAATRAPVRVVLVLDRSLSMAGDPIAHARDLGRGVLDLLDPRDSVGLVSFADDVQRVTPAAATPAQRQKLEAELTGAVASGGSNLAAALDEATAMLAGAPGGVVVLMTDGQPTAGDGVDDDLPAAKAADVAKARVVIAHFNYPSRQAALEHLFPGAQLHYVPDGRAGDAAVKQLARLAAAPSIEDLKITVAGATGDLQGVIPQTLAMGEDVRIAARADTAVTVHVTGQLHGHSIALEQTIAVPAAPDASGDGGLAVEWARLRVADLDRRFRAGETGLADEIKRLGTDYRLATRFTSFVADPVAVDDSLSPDRIRPGDPEIRVHAPRSMQDVYATLPWGERVPCEWEPIEGVWLGRFLVPRGARDGMYRVRVYTNDQGRVALRGTLMYRVDDQAPKFRLDATYGAGILHLRATPVDAVFEARNRDSIRGDKVDLRRAVVRVDGRDVELHRDGETWTADVSVALTGTLSLSLVATDYAGNASTATVALDAGSTGVAL
ncbi:MAG TPA: VIT and VWA domain-containing protein [Kofleriaceae bacterium]|nr:VIT and VWA domain-containing protein [Kofleriaceae bacterium]